VSDGADYAGSIAGEWNTLLLSFIRTARARPAVHARNLYHLAAVMFDTWSAYYQHEVEGVQHVLPTSATTVEAAAADEAIAGLGEVDRLEAVRESISYASYVLLEHRFKVEVNVDLVTEGLRAKMAELGYPLPTGSGGAVDPVLDPRSIGIAIGKGAISFGLGDNATEEYDYDYAPEGHPAHYAPVNKHNLNPFEKGSGPIDDPNRWQRLHLEEYIDQSGNHIAGYPPYTGPNWGFVTPFSLKRTVDPSDDRAWDLPGLYLDPGQPPRFGTDEYKMNFSTVALFSGMLNPYDGERWDVSPGTIGDVEDGVWDEYRGNVGRGWRVNPTTGMPYEPHWALKGDYTRVLAEFWADGPDSETPPGHWHSMLNYVLQHPKLDRRIGGKGFILPTLEYDLKAYLTLGAAMHDAAIVAWGCKRHYDYIRPISAIRYMAGLGQSSDKSAPSYHPDGLPLFPRGSSPDLLDSKDVGGGIELITKLGLNFSAGGDKTIFVSDLECPNSGEKPNCLDEVAMYGWDVRWHSRWMLAERFWPYQRPSFVTPPFAGYVSGHSTFSRTAADIITRFTGSPFFPGGLGVHTAPKDNFLVFEVGPKESVQLQWATYRDAADECGLSRIWGGIHPPIDDLAGRRMGRRLAPLVWDSLQDHFGTTDTKAASRVTLRLEFEEPTSAADAQLLVVRTLRGDPFGVGESIPDFADYADLDDLAESRLDPLLDGAVPGPRDVSVRRPRPHDPDNSVRLRVFSNDPRAADKLSAALVDTAGIVAITVVSDTDESLARGEVDDDVSSLRSQLADAQALAVGLGIALAVVVACCVPLAAYLGRRSGTSVSTTLLAAAREEGVEQERLDAALAAKRKASSSGAGNSGRGKGSSKSSARRGSGVGLTRRGRVSGQDRRREKEGEKEGESSSSSSSE
jgi:hypothetical protein